MTEKYVIEIDYDCDSHLEIDLPEGVTEADIARMYDTGGGATMILKDGREFSFNMPEPEINEAYNIRLYDPEWDIVADEFWNEKEQNPKFDDKQPMPVVYNI